MLAVSTGPILKSVEATGNRRVGRGGDDAGPLLLLVIPLWAAIDTIAEHCKS
jgi:hypothetical protein